MHSFAFGAIGSIIAYQRQFFVKPQWIYDFVYFTRNIIQWDFYCGINTIHKINVISHFITIFNNTDIQLLQY